MATRTTPTPAGSAYTLGRPGQAWCRGAALNASPALPLAPVLLRPSGPWRILSPAAKLRVRGGLPGAYGYDLAAHSFRCARAAGMAPIELLPAALPTSWMVNSRAASPVFRRWLTRPLHGAWVTLLARLGGEPADAARAGDASAHGDASTDAAAGAGDASAGDTSAGDASAAALGRDIVAACSALCIEGHGLAAVSKVLALLLPEVVPLLDDAAIWLLTEGVARPDTADVPTAGADLLLANLAAFEQAVVSNEAALVALARDYTLAPLDAPQTLDRLLWFESWGWRLFAATPGRAGWAWVADGEREGVVEVPAGGPAREPTARLDLGSLDGGDAWGEQARHALSAAWG
jgi:hypothetical protein